VCEITDRSQTMVFWEMSVIHGQIGKMKKATDGFIRGKADDYVGRSPQAFCKKDHASGRDRKRLRSRKKFVALRLSSQTLRGRCPPGREASDASPKNLKGRSHRRFRGRKWENTSPAKIRGLGDSSGSKPSFKNEWRWTTLSRNLS